MNGRAWTGAAMALSAAAALTAGCAGTGGPPMRAPPAAGGRCADVTLQVYFAPGSAELTGPARDLIRSAANRVAGCRIGGVDVTGVGAPDAAGRPLDAVLTQKRADAVAQALASAGLPGPTFDIQVAGGAAAPAGSRTPLSRRTEVVVHARPAA